jgi:septum formation topological specificity factor MinE
VDERERQRVCRAAQKRRGGGVLSRSGLSAEVPELQQELLEIVDRHVEMSRTGLRREVSRLLRFRVPKVKQARAEGP